MTTLNKLIDKARKMCQRDSDAAVAEHLGVSRQTVMMWRRGALRITDEHLANVIALAQADPALAVLVRQESAATKAEKALWGPLWDRLSPVTTKVAGVLLAVGLAAPSPVDAAAIAQAEQLDPIGIMRIRRWLARLMQAWRYEPSAVLA